MQVRLIHSILHLRRRLPTLHFQMYFRTLCFSAPGEQQTRKNSTDGLNTKNRPECPDKSKQTPARKISSISNASTASSSSKTNECVKDAVEGSSSGAVTENDADDAPAHDDKVAQLSTELAHAKEALNGECEFLIDEKKSSTIYCHSIKSP